ncbi:MAG: hypothetical protein ABJ178_00065, partial [Marinomonas sp.]
ALGVTFAMAIRSVLNVGTLVIEPALAARDRTGLVAMFNLVWTVITILSVLAASPFGLIALAVSQAVVMLLTTLSAFVVLRRESIEVSGAVRSLFIAAGLSVLYGVALYVLWQPLSATIQGDMLAVLAGIGLAAVLGAVTLALGWKLRVFTLSVFSG